jgi:DNA ligase-associated metallophosphoesterase
VFLPPYDTRSTLRRLAALCRTLKPRIVVSLGDAFHDGDAEARLDGQDADLLAELVSSHRWIWAFGNHDPAPPRRFAGETADEVRLGGLILRHEAAKALNVFADGGEISGHFHPCARVRIEGRTQRRRCFAAGSGRLILPAFGAYAGGLNILDPAFEPFFDSPVAWILGESGVYPMPARRLEPDFSRPSRTAAR